MKDEREQEILDKIIFWPYFLTPEMLQVPRGATDGCFGGAPAKVVIEPLGAWFESWFELAEGTSLFGAGDF